jgi:hypothetical protein
MDDRAKVDHAAGGLDRVLVLESDDRPIIGVVTTDEVRETRPSPSPDSSASTPPAPTEANSSAVGVIRSASVTPRRIAELSLSAGLSS